MTTLKKSERERAIQRFKDGFGYDGIGVSAVRFKWEGLFIWCGEVIAWTEQHGEELHLKWDELEDEIVRELFNDILFAFGSRQHISRTSNGRWVIGLNGAKKRAWTGSFCWRKPIDWKTERGL